MAEDALQSFTLEQLNVLHDRAGNDAVMAARIDSVRRAKGYDPGTPSATCPGLMERVVYAPGDRLKQRPMIKSEGADSLPFMAPFMLGGQRGRFDQALVQAERRGGTVETVFVPKGERPRKSSEGEHHVETA